MSVGRICVRDVDTASPEESAAVLLSECISGLSERWSSSTINRKWSGF